MPLPPVGEALAALRGASRLDNGLTLRGGRGAARVVAEDVNAVRVPKNAQNARSRDPAHGKPGSVDPVAPKSGGGGTTRTIDPNANVRSASNAEAWHKAGAGAVKPVAIGLAAAGGLAALGYAAQSIGNGVYEAHKPPQPAYRDLAGGGLLYTDPTTGATFVINPSGSIGDSKGTVGNKKGYQVTTLQTPEQANAAKDKNAETSFFSSTLGQLAIVGLVVVVVIIAIVASKGRGGAVGAK